MSAAGTLLDQIVMPRGTPALFSKASTHPYAAPVLAWHPLDDVITDLVVLFAAASAREQEEIWADLQSRDGWTLLTEYCVRMSAFAVRTRDPEKLFHALLALAVENSRRVRETMMTVSVVYHSARKLGVDPVKIFDRAADQASAAVARILQDFARRDPEMADVALMGWREAEDANGFRYDFGWPRRR